MAGRALEPRGRGRPLPAAFRRCWDQKVARRHNLRCRRQSDIRVPGKSRPLGATSRFSAWGGSDNKQPIAARGGFYEMNGATQQGHHHLLADLPSPTGWQLMTWIT